MNRLTFIKLLKETFKIFLEHNGEIEITEERREEYENVMDALAVPSKIDENTIAYLEVDFLCYLFENIPYYVVSQVLQDYEKNLYLLFNQTPKKHLANMLTAYLRELSPNYNRRINSELCAHTSALLNFYLLYTEEELQQENLEQKQILILDRNLFDPNRIFGLGQAESYRYTQQSLFEEENIDSVREKVGKSNYINADKIEKDFLELVQQLDTYEDYEKFRKYARKLCLKQAHWKFEKWKQNDQKDFFNRLVDVNDIARIARLVDIYLDDLNKTIKANFKEKEKQKKEINNSLLFQIENW